MRIAYLSQCSIPSEMANSVQVMKMCAAFARQHHDVTLFAMKGSGQVDPFQFYGTGSGFRLCSMPVAAMRGMAGPKFGRDCVRLACLDAMPNIFYARHIYGLCFALQTGASVIYEAHALPRSRIHAALLRWAFRHPNFRYLVAISGTLQKDYLACFHNLAGRTRIAHDAADLPAAGQAFTARARNVSRSETFKVGYVGALYPGKGMELIAALASRLPEFEFHIVGGDVNAVRGWRRRLPEPNVHFHGHVPHAETSQWIASFDVALLPLQRRVGSLPSGGQDIGRWTSPLKLFEYMAHGKPIIASDLPVLREVIEPGQNALIASAETPEEWIQALTQLAVDPELRCHLGTNARADVERAYTWDKRVERVLSGLES